MTIRAALKRFGRAAHRLVVEPRPDGVGIDLGGLDLGGAWVTITVEDATGAERNTSFLLNAVEGEEAGALLPEEPLGGGRFGWTGRLPLAVTALRLSPIFVTDPLTVREVTVRRRGRLGLVLRGVRRDARLTREAVYWRLLSKKVRSRAMLARAVMPQPERGYRAWLKRQPPLTGRRRRSIAREIAAWRSPPLVSILMPVHDPSPSVLEAAIRSVEAQLYPYWQLCIADDASRDPDIPRLLDRMARNEPRIRLMRRAENGHIARATNDALALASGDWALFLDHDDLLPRTALYEIARVIVADPDLVLVYGDEDKVDPQGERFEPHFKPAFDLELLFGQNYINHPTAIRMPELRALGGLRPGFEGSQDHDLLLRLTQDLDPVRIRHIPAILYHWRAGDGSGTFSDRALAAAEDARLRAVADAVSKSGALAERGPLGYARVVRPLPDPPPRVSVVIPTRDRGSLLRTVLDGLLDATDYPDIEVVVVDNGSREPEAVALLTWLAGTPRFRLVQRPGPFNFSDLCNEGAAAASGEVLLFLNNDVEVIEPGWLRELVSRALEPGIGAVGAKLLYPDGTLQHGGVVLRERSVAGHAHPGLGGDEPGYFGRMLQAHEVSAVTGACLAMRKPVFEEAGGFDAEELAVAYNDVDLCLRLRRLGYRIVWTPFARLVHHESRSRGLEDTPDKTARLAREAAVMKQRWGSELAADPYYSRSFVPDSLDFQI